MNGFIFGAVISTMFFLGIPAGNDTIGKAFPDIKGETLSGTVKTIPADTKGKYTLIAMAYSSDADNDLSSWINPVYNKFIVKTGMFDSEYDVNLVFIPMFSGENFATASIIKKRMKEEINKTLHSSVVFYKGDLDKYKKELNIVKKDTPYIFMLDKSGNILYATDGNYTDEKMEAIEEKLK